MTNMQTFYKRAMVFSTPSAIFRVPTRDRGDVFMRIGRTNYENDRRAVVEVDAEKFLDLWRRDPYGAHADVSRGNLATWIKDRKFSGAEDGFADGVRNPVPLADVCCEMHIAQMPLYRSRFLLFRNRVGYERDDIAHVSFTDGITRTIWLLTHGARVFPVMCRASDAPLLQQLAGLPGGSYCTVEQLVPAPGASLRTYAAAVFERNNIDLFEQILEAFEGTADELGYRFVTGTSSHEFPGFVRRALGEAVVTARIRHVFPLRSAAEIERSLGQACEDGYGDAWVTSIMKALALQGIVPELRRDQLQSDLEGCVVLPGDDHA